MHQCAAPGDGFSAWRFGAPGTRRDNRRDSHGKKPRGKLAPGTWRRWRARMQRARMQKGPTMLRWIALSLGCLMAASAAQAQTAYPTKTITIVVTAAAGGVSDVVARG